MLFDDVSLDEPLVDAMQSRLADRQVVSKTVASSQARLSAHRFDAMRLHLSMCLLWADRLFRASLEHFLSESLDANVMMYCDGPHAHDEFSIKMGFDLAVPDVGGPGVVRAGSDGRTAGVCKVLQTQSRYGMLVHLGSRYIVVQGSQSTWLQVLESTSGEVILKALHHGLFEPKFTKARAFKVRLACTDAHKATKKAEESLMADLDGWFGLHLFCEAHYAAICLRHTLALVPAASSGLVHLTLALRGSSGHIATFRKCLAATILARLKILHGKPTLQAHRYREECLKIFGNDRPHWASRVAIFRCLANGDWGNTKFVEHYTSSVDEPSPEEISAAFAQKLVWALVPTTPVIFKPKTWGDTDHALSDLWILSVCHGLLEPTFQHFCRVVASSTEAVSQPAVAQPNSTVGVPPSSAR